MNLPAGVALLRWDVQRYLSSRIAVFWTFAFPVLLLVLLSQVFGSNRAPLGHVELRVQDDDHTPQSSALILATTRNLARVEALSTAITRVSACSDKLTCLIIPAGYSASIRGEGRLDLMLSTAQIAPAAASIISSTLDAAIDRQVLTEARDSNSRPHLRVTAEPAQSTVYDSTYLATGLLVMSLLTAALMGFALPLVGLREARLFNMYQLMPLSRTTFMSAFIGSRLLIMLVFSVVFLGVGAAFFHARLPHGVLSVLAGLALLILGTVCFIAMGFAVASRISKIATATVVCNALYFAQTFLGNLFIPLDSLPGWLRNVLNVLPANTVTAALRATTGSAAEDPSLLRSTLIISAWTVAFLLFTRFAFVWRKSTRA